MGGQRVGQKAYRTNRSGGPTLARRRTAVLAVSGVVFALISIVSHPAVAGAPAVAPVTTESARAAALGHRVEVVSARDEYSTTYANPDGTFELDQAVSPVRVRGADGDWHQPDATLERRADGSVGPRFAAVDMSFSGGGSDPMVVLRSQGRSVAMSFPGSLPAPVLDGADATYPEVYPGVDLKVSASTTGFRQVLVVKTRAAAQNPAVRSLSFGVSAHGLQVRQAASGAFEATDGNGAPVFGGPAGMMWDSGQTQTQATGLALSTHVGAPAGMLADGESDTARAHAPAARSRVADLRTRVSAKALTVTPSAAWLDDPATTYPVFIDPPIGATGGGYTVFRSDGWKDWNFANDEGVGKCGSLTISGTTYTCGPGYVQRQAFKFTNSNLVGKYVLKGVFRIRETWSFTCTPSVTQLSRLSSNITSSTGWPGPSTVDLVADESFSAGRGTLCSPQQPDRDIEFADDAGDTSDNLTSTVRNLADGVWSSVSFLLRNASETNTGDWKRFVGSTATLQVTYVAKPGVPTTTGVRATSSTTTSCSTNSAAPTTVTRLTPMLAATLQTEKPIATGEDPALLAGQFQVFTLTSGTPTWDSGVATSGWQPDNHISTPSVPAGKLVEGPTYRMRVRTQSHYTGGDLFSGFSGWCYFRAVLNAPQESTITSQTNPANGIGYPLCNPDCTAAGGPGLSGQFMLTNPMVTVTSFRWSLIKGGAVVDSGTVAATTSAGLQTAYIQPTPQLDGVHELNVIAVNAAGDGAPWSEYISVALGAAPVGEWKVADVNAPGVDTSGGGHDLTLQGATASSLGRRAASDANGDGALNVQGAGQAAVTSVPILDTSGSFTVSAWVYLRSKSGYQIVLSQGNNSPLHGFQLYYSGPDDKWKMGLTQTTAGGQVVSVQSVGKAAPVLGAWTHLTGVYDAVGKTLELYVNGVSQGKVAVGTAASTATTGVLMIGRDEMGPTPENFSGLIDEVTVWNRLITAPEAARQTQTLDANGAPASALVGFWEPSNPDTPLVDQSGYGHPDLALSGGANVSSGDGLVLNGTDAGGSTTGPLVDENGSFTVTAKVHNMTAKTGKGRLISQRAGASGVSWSIYYDYGTSQWKFERTGLNAAGATVTATASSAVTPVDPGDVAVTGRYDAAQGTLEVLVTLGSQQCSVNCVPITAQGTGEVNVGMTRSSSTGPPADLLAGTVDWMRVWSGAVTDDNLAKVIF